MQPEWYQSTKHPALCLSVNALCTIHFSQASRQDQTSKREQKLRFRQFTQYFSRVIWCLFQSRASLREQQFFYNLVFHRKIENHFSWSSKKNQADSRKNLWDWALRPPKYGQICIFGRAKYGQVGVLLKISCKMQFRRVGLRSMGLLHFIQCPFPNQIQFGLEK